MEAIYNLQSSSFPPSYTFFVIDVYVVKWFSSIRYKVNPLTHNVHLSNNSYKALIIKHSAKLTEGVCALTVLVKLL